MAIEESNDALEQDQMEEGSPSGEGSGNFFSRFGKIFLIVAVLLGQAGSAYAIMSVYFDKIHTLVSSLTPEGGVYHSLENIIINTANSNGERYLIVTIAIELYSAGDLEQVERNEVRIIDEVNQILSRRSARDLANLETRAEVKEEIGTMINKSLDKKTVRNLFFTKYVIQ